MKDIEVILNDLGRELAKKHKPQGLEENKEIAKVARTNLKEKLGESVISNKNTLEYQYIDNLKQIENK